MRKKRLQFATLNILILCFIVLGLFPAYVKAEETNLPWEGATLYAVSLEQSKMVQLDYRTYWYTFTPAEAGQYTFYLEKGPNDAYTQIFNGAGQLIEATATSPSFLGEYYPAGYTITCDAEATYYISVRGSSNSASKTNLCVVKYQQQDMTLSAITPVSDTIPAGNPLLLDIPVDQTDIAGVSVSIVDDNENTTSNQFNYPKIKDGQIQVRFDYLEAGKTYTVSQVEILDNHGIPYNLTIPFDLNSVSASVLSLQDTLDEKSSQGGGTVKLDYSPSIETPVIIPENVTLELSDGLVINSTLTVNGTLLVTGGYVNARSEADVSKGADGAITVLSGEISIERGQDDQYVMDHTIIEAGYGVTASYDSGDSYQWRHGKWRVPISDGAVPEDEEIIDLDSPEFDETYSSTEELRDEAWYRFTVPTDWDKAKISFDNYVSESQNMYVELRKAEDNIVITGTNSYSNVFSLSSELTPGSTYYIRLSMYDGHMSPRIKGSYTNDYMTAQEMAALMNFDDAALTVEDTDDPSVKKVRASIPVALEFPSDAQNIYLVYSNGYNYQHLYKTDGMGNVLYLENDIDVLPFTEEDVQYNLEYFCCQYDGIEYRLYPRESQENSYNITTVDMPDALKKIEIEAGHQEVTDLELGAEPVQISTNKSAFRFIAPEEGSYTFYLTNEGYVTHYRKGESGQIIDCGGIGYPYSITSDMGAGEEAYFIAHSYNSWQDCAFGVTADTGEVSITDISITGNENDITAGSQFRVDVQATGEFRSIMAAFGKNSSNTELYAANTDERWHGGSTGTYYLQHIEVTDQYGRSRYYYDDDLDDIDFSDFKINARSLSDYLKSQKEAGLSEVTIDSLLYSFRDEQLVIPEGLTLNVRSMYLDNNQSVQAEGTLIVDNLTVSSMASLALGDNGAIICRETNVANSSLYDVDAIIEIITGNQKGARLSGYQNGVPKFYQWDGNEWKPARDDGMPDINDMADLVLLGADEKEWSDSTEPINQEYGEGNRYWYKRTIEESGIYEIELTNPEEYWINTYIYSDDTYHYLGYERTGLYLEAGERLCVSLGCESEELSSQIRLKKAEAAGMTAADLAGALDVDNMTIEVSDNDALQCNEVSVSLPFEDPQGVRIEGAEVYLADESGSDIRNVWLEKDGSVLKGSSNISWSLYDSPEKYHLSRISIQTSEPGQDEEETRYTNWNIYYNQTNESGVQSGYIRDTYTQTENLPTCNLKFTGPMELFTEEETALLVNNSIRVKFTPSEDGDYVIVKDNPKLYEEWDEGWKTSNDDWLGTSKMKAGTTYYRSLCYSYDDEEVPEYVTVHMLKDDAVPEVTGITLPSEISNKQIVPVDIAVNSENDVDRISISLGSKENDEASGYLSVENLEYENGILHANVCLDETDFLEYGDKLNVSSLHIFDKYGKNNSISSEVLDEFADVTTTYQSCKTVIEKGGTLAFSDLYLNEDDVITVPAGSNIDAKSLYMNENSKMVLNGTVTVNNYMEISSDQVILEGGKINLENEGRIPDASYLSYLTGAGSDSTVYVENEEIFYYWTGKGWQAKADNPISFTVTDPDDSEDLDLGAVPVDKEIRLTVQADGMKEAEFYNGSEYIIPDEFDEENSTASVNISFEKTGSFVVKARVRFEEEGDWIYSDELDIDVIAAKEDISQMTFNLESDEYEFTGEEICPPVTSEEGLIADEDYTVSYSDNVNPGEDATVIIQGCGNYEGSIGLSFAILKGRVDLSAALSGALEQTETSYTATYKDVLKLTAEATHAYGDGVQAGLISYESDDESVASVDESGNVILHKAGQVTFTVTSAETEQLEAVSTEITLTINKAKPEITVPFTRISQSLANADPVLISATITDGLELFYESNKPDVAEVDAEGKVTLKMTGNALITVFSKENECYEAADPVQVEIEVEEEPKQNINSIEFSISKETYDFTGEEICPEVTTESELVQNTDYEVGYMDNINPTTEERPAKVLINGIGKYEGSVIIPFTIRKGDAELEMSVSNARKLEGSKYQAFFGDIPKLTAELKHNYGNGVQAGAIAFESSNPDIVNVDGSGTVTLLQEGNAVITISAAETQQLNAVQTQISIEVLKKNIGDFKFTISSETCDFTGKENCPEVTSEDKLVKDIDYQVGYTNNINPTTEGNPAYVEITGIGKYKGTKQIAFSIKKGRVSLTASLDARREDDGNYTVMYGDTPKILAGITHEYGDDVAVGAISYKSSDESVATADENGNVTLHKAGDVTFTVTSSATDQLEAAAAEELKLTVTKASPVISVRSRSISRYMTDGTTVSLGAKINQKDLALSYISDKPEVAEPGTDGTVTLKKVGTAVITVSSQETDQCEAADPVKVTVVVKAEKASIKAKKKTVNLGTAGTADATYDIISEQLFERSDKGTLVIESSDSGIATYDDVNHQLAGHSAGEAEMTAYIAADETEGLDESNKVTFTVKVYEPVVVFDKSKYISVSSALSAAFEKPAEDDPALLTLIKDTPNSEILHKGSDYAKILEGRSVILNLNKHSYNGALRIFGTLTLRNRAEEGFLAQAFGLFKADGESDNDSIGALVDDATFKLSGNTGTLIIESDEEDFDESTLKVSGDTAKIENEDADTSSKVVKYFAKLEKAVKEASDAETGNEVTVKLTNDAALENPVSLNNVKLDLNGNNLSADNSEAKLSGGSIEDSTKAGENNQTLLSKDLLDESNKPEVDSNTVETLGIPDFEPVIPEEDYYYNGRSPHLRVKVNEFELPEKDSQNTVEIDGEKYYSVALPGPGTVGDENQYKAEVYRIVEGKEDQKAAIVNGVIPVKERIISASDISISVLPRNYEKGNRNAELQIDISESSGELKKLLEDDGIEIKIADAALFDSEDAGENKPVNFRLELEANGNDDSVINNYSLETPAEIKGTIQKAELDETEFEISNETAVYTGTKLGMKNLPDPEGASRISLIYYDSDNHKVIPVKPGEYRVQAEYEADDNHVFKDGKDSEIFKAVFTIAGSDELKAAENKVNAVIEAVGKLDEVLEKEGIEAYEKAINDIKTMTGEITKEDKDLLKNSSDSDILDKLSKAENALNEAETKLPGLKKEASDKAAAQTVVDKINAIDVNKIEASDQAAIEAIQTEYSKLTEDQLKYVDEDVKTKLQTIKDTVDRKVTEKAEADKKADQPVQPAQNPQPSPQPQPAPTNPVISLGALDSPVVLKKGATKSITVFVTEKDITKITTDLAKVTSAKAKIAKVSATKLVKGRLTFKVKGLKAGKSTVKVQVGSKVVNVKVTVLKKANTAKKLTAKKKVNVRKGKIAKVVVKVAAKDAKFAVTDVVTAKSGKAAIAAVTNIATAKGKVTVKVKGIKKGKSVLTVKVGKKKVKVTVNVK